MANNTKFKECKSNEEILKVAAEEGVELTEEQLEAVSGGNCINDPTCPNCHGGSYWTSWSDWHETNVEYHWYFLVITDTHYEERTCTCTKCGKVIQTQHRHRTHYQSGEISSWDSWTYDD